MKIIAPPTHMLVTLNEKKEIVPSAYAKAAREAGLEIVTWTLERSGPLASGGGFYYQSIKEAIHSDADVLKLLDVLAKDVKCAASSPTGRPTSPTTPTAWGSSQRLFGAADPDAASCGYRLPRLDNAPLTPCHGSIAGRIGGEGARSMPIYSPIRRWMDGVEKARTAERLLALRRKLSSEITDRVGKDSLLIATWNLRDFDSNRLGNGPRLRESFYYIAEIVSAFDLVVVQEVSRNLDGLEALMAILGEAWDYLASPAVEVQSGSEERLAILFRPDKLRFRKIAGEVVLPGGQMTAGQGAEADAPSGALQFVRAPFMAAFEAGVVRLNFCVLHLRHRRGNKNGLQHQAAELEALARYFREKQDREREDYILIGDFSIAARSDLMARVLEQQGFDIPEPLTRKRAHLDGSKYYDQIAFRIRKDRLEPGNAGTFRHFDAVFRDNDEDYAAYQEMMPEERANDLWNGGPRGYYTQQWRSWQISDHQPLWVELKVDFSDHYLDMIRKSAGAV